jgi:hypothetical protein
MDRQRNTGPGLGITLCRGLALATTLAALAAPATANTAVTPPAQPQGSAASGPGLKPCLLVVAGPGAEAKSESVTAFWHTVNAGVAEKLVEKLSADGHAARVAVVPQKTPAGELSGQIALALARERCHRLLQIRHQLGGGSGPDAFFAFDAAALDVTEAARGFRLGKELFRKTCPPP